MAVRTRVRRARDTPPTQTAIVTEACLTRARHGAPLRGEGDSEKIDGGDAERDEGHRTSCGRADDAVARNCERGDGGGRPEQRRDDHSQLLFCPVPLGEAMLRGMKELKNHRRRLHLGLALPEREGFTVDHLKQLQGEAKNGE